MIKLNERVINYSNFPDGTKSLEYDTGYCWDGDKFPIYWYYENEEEMITIYYLVDHIRNRNKNASISLNMPYIPNARMDRIENDKTVFTLKYFCKFINDLTFDYISVLDPHSNVAPALINNCFIESPKEFIDIAIKESMPNIIFFPDEGSYKRYSKMIDKPQMFGIKERKKEVVSMDIHGEIPKEPFDVLIVDDICSYGGTFYHSAIKLKEVGARNIYLYVTHCENSILEGKFTELDVPLLDTGLITKVFTTNSIFDKKHESIKVVDIRWRAI